MTRRLSTRASRMLRQPSRTASSATSRPRDLSASCISKMSQVLAIGDRDNLGENKVTGDLLAIDYNGSAPRLATVRDPFGTPTFEEYANPPSISTLLDIAVSPDTGRAFTAGSTDLVEIDVATDSYVTIGSFGTERRIMGLTFAPASAVVPEPSTYANLALLFAIGGFALHVRHRRKRKPA